MRDFGRRAILKALSAAPLAGHVLAEQTKMNALGRGMLVGGAGSMGQVVSASSTAPLQFIDFAHWLRDVGRERAKRQARDIQGFDPDIVEMRLPLATKVSMQRGRNLVRIIEEQRRDFLAEVTRNGVFKWWP